MNKERALIVQDDAKSPIAEAYRVLRTNLLFAKAGEPVHIVIFTSSGPGEGKSTTAANTAVSFAQTGRKVILVDCDLRKPVQHKIFGLTNKGVTNVLVEKIPVEDLLQPTATPNLSILTSGPIPPNPSELLGSDRMAKLLAELKERAEIVILDMPPVISVTDASVLASAVDGIILVVASGMVRPEMAQKAKDLLQRAKGHILGVVLNRVEIEKKHAYYYYYYGSDSKKR